MFIIHLIIFKYLDKAVDEEDSLHVSVGKMLLCPSERFSKSRLHRIVLMCKIIKVCVSA